MLDIITKDALILKSVTRYYEKNPKIYEKLTDIVEKRSKISISMVEYFTLTYAKNKSTMYLKENGNFFIVYLNYKNFLKSYGKKYTDPFRRKQDKDEKDFHFTCHEKEIKTRLAQLHFFKFAFENEIIHYIETNFKKIDEQWSKDKKNKNKGTQCVSRISQFHIEST